MHCNIHFKQIISRFLHASYVIFCALVSHQILWKRIRWISSILNYLVDMNLTGAKWQKPRPNQLLSTYSNQFTTLRTVWWNTLKISLRDCVIRIFSKISRTFSIASRKRRIPATNKHCSIRPTRNVDEPCQPTFFYLLNKLVIHEINDLYFTRNCSSEFWDFGNKS